MMKRKLLRRDSAGCNDARRVRKRKWWEVPLARGYRLSFGLLLWRAVCAHGHGAPACQGKQSKRGEEPGRRQGKGGWIVAE